MFQIPLEVSLEIRRWKHVASQRLDVHFRIFIKTCFRYLLNGKLVCQPAGDGLHAAFFQSSPVESLQIEMSAGPVVPAVAGDVTDDGPLSLGQLWEADRGIRARLRENEFKLVKWVKPELINKPTMAGIALNCRALVILAKWWCPQQTKAKSPSVLDLKKEADRSIKKVYNYGGTRFCRRYIH